MQPPKPSSSSPPSSMETHRRKASASDTASAFSFPSTPLHSSSSPSPTPSSSCANDDFEFGCLTPDSPSSDPNKDSPADHLFFNGRLLPHAFPCRSPAVVISRGTSRTSSTSSKQDYSSLVSSRSNSSNSSCSSSARTSSSSSDNSERRTLLYCRQNSKTTLTGSGSSKAVSAHVYGSSQRWQFMAPVPALSREGSRRRKVTEEKNKAVAKKPKRPRRFGRRIFRWLVTTCKKCHAIEPSRKEDVLRRNVKLR